MIKKGLRYYIQGLLIVIMAMNIPEVHTIIEDHVKIAAPVVRQAAELSYNEISAALLPYTGKILGKAKIVVNGQPVAVDTSDDMSLNHGQSLTAEQIDAILAESKSPAVGTGPYFLKYGLQHKIDAAYMLAIFYYESKLGTDKEWAGYKPDGTHTYNIGNMICAGYQHCYGGFRDYSEDADPWASAIEDNTHLLAIYRDNNGIKDFGTAITKWAPPSENNTKAYIDGTEKMIRSWRNTNRVINNDGGQVIQVVQDNGTKIPFGDAQAVSAPITENTADGFGLNVKAALDANGGALRHITIKDGEQWSFNETLGNPDGLQLAYVSGVYGGGWCDLACRYVQVFKGLGIPITHGTDMSANGAVFLQHGGIQLNQCSFDESPYIWSAGNKGFDNGMQDLVVNNGTGKTIRITVVDNQDGTATIAGKLE